MNCSACAGAKCLSTVSSRVGQTSILASIGVPSGVTVRTAHPAIRVARPDTTTRAQVRDQQLDGRGDERSQKSERRPMRFWVLVPEEQSPLVYSPPSWFFGLPVASIRGE